MTLHNDEACIAAEESRKAREYEMLTLIQAFDSRLDSLIRSIESRLDKVEKDIISLRSRSHDHFAG